MSLSRGVIQGQTQNYWSRTRGGLSLGSSFKWRATGVSQKGDSLFRETYPTDEYLRMQYCWKIQASFSQRGQLYSAPLTEGLMPTASTSNASDCSVLNVKEMSASCSRSGPCNSTKPLPSRPTTRDFCHRQTVAEVKGAVVYCTYTGSHW